LAGKSTLNRLELSRAEPSRYHKISYDAALIEAVFVDVYLDAHTAPPAQIILDLDATDDPLHGHQEGRFFHGYYDNTDLRKFLDRSVSFVSGHGSIAGTTRAPL